MKALSDAVIAWIEQSVGSGARVSAFEELPPSATVKHLVELELEDGSALRLVLRRYHDVERLAEDPWYAPEYEALALRLLAESAVPAPRLFAADLGPSVCDAPALLESWIPGEPVWRPDDINRYLAKAAEALVAIHGVSVPANAGLPRYAPYNGLERIVSPSFSTRPGLWERVRAALDVQWPAHRETFIHRDYHPGNALWDGTRVTGVVDWATAASGPPGIDLARMRQNLASHLGKDVADRFLRAYVAAGGDPSAHDPYWDLLDAADTLPDLTSPVGPGGGDLARFEDYVEGVLTARAHR